jgi:hypothetical protein
MPDAKKNTAYAFDIVLVDASTRPSFKSTPTLATGDFKVSIDDGAFANLTTLPTVSPAAEIQVKISLSAAEMNGDRIGVSCIDQTSPKEWDDVYVYIDTTAVTVDDLTRAATPANLHTSQTGDNFARLGAPVGASISADIAAVQADTDNVQTRIPTALVGGRMESNASAIDGNAAAAANLKQSTLGIVTAVVGTGSTTTSIVTSSMSPAAAVIDQFKGKIVTFAEDTTTVNLRGQSTDITGNTAAGVLTTPPSHPSLASSRTSPREPVRSERGDAACA